MAQVGTTGDYGVDGDAAAGAMRRDTGYKSNEFECIVVQRNRYRTPCYYTASTKLTLGALRHSAPPQLPAQAPPRLVNHSSAIIHSFFLSCLLSTGSGKRPHFSLLTPFSPRFYLTFFLSLYPGYSIHNGQSEADSQGNQLRSIFIKIGLSS